MKKQTILLLAIAGVAAYFYFKNKNSSPAKNQLANLVNALPESDDYKQHFLSEIAQMTSDEVSALIAYLSSTARVITPQIQTIYQKYLLGS